MLVKVSFGGQIKSIDGFSKLSKISELRKKISENFPDIPPKLQRLLHRGKQLEDGKGNTFHDYRFGMSDLVQVMKRQPLMEKQSSNIEIKDDETEKKEEQDDKETLSSPKVEEKSPKDSRVEKVSEYFMKGDHVDVREDGGDHYEGTILGTYEMTSEDSFTSSDGIAYAIHYEGYSPDDPTYKGLESLRLRSHKTIDINDLKPEQHILATFNMEAPKKRGNWFACTVKKVVTMGPRSMGPHVIANISMGETSLDDKKLFFTEEFYELIENIPVKDREGPHEEKFVRTQPPKCSKCEDVERKYCSECSCKICRKKDRPDEALMCDDCNACYHMNCLDPPLDKIPEDDWYCPDCKISEDDIVVAGANPLKHRNLKNAPAYNPKSKRDWGKGYATAGRTKECTKVPPNHFGPIPGIEVGMSWKYRIQMSEEGIHRPPVAGISGSEKIGGANSIVLAGGYAEDEDNGDEFWYTGAGGRDLSGNRRTAEQTFDQILNKTNLAIAVSCNAKVDKDVGADAGEKWRDGKPIRVTRSYKLKKHSTFAPLEGLRYDGIYKVVKYEFVPGKSGFKVWRFMFRRDDESPAPWTDEGVKNIRDNGYVMILPNEDPNANNKKRKADELDGSPSKKIKTDFKINDKILSLVKDDVKNKSLWDDVINGNFSNKRELIDKVEEDFMCICCQEILFKPVTTECNHNFCYDCIKRSFSASVYNCPMCRAELGKDYELIQNKQLRAALNELFPLYESGR